MSPVINSDSSASTFFIRVFSQFLVAIVLLYLATRYLIYWHDWPSIAETLQSFLGDSATLAGGQQLKGIIIIGFYIAIFSFIVFLIKRSPNTSLSVDAEKFKNWAYYIIRAAFWAVFLIGTADAIISFLRVENLLEPLVGKELNDSLGISSKRGVSVHYPLLLVSLVIAFFTRSLSFIWLSLLVVFAEFGIVLTRFIFSYEQAFMGDLVRFWYAALFLFASAYTLAEGGHVRVDVLYARMGNRKKAWVNAFGSLLLGLPVCWSILHYGVGTEHSSLIAPILGFEVSQSGYGMYVKYLMGGFLIIYAVSMALMFVSYFLSSCAYLLNETDAVIPSGGEH